MIRSADLEELAEKTLSLLANVGILVENQEVRRRCVHKGCTAGPDHRLKLRLALIDALAAGYIHRVAGLDVYFLVRGARQHVRVRLEQRVHVLGQELLHL